MPPSEPQHGLYIHLPWCVRKCPYCDFNSHALRAEPVPETEYLVALLADLDHELAWLGWRPILGSIFLGGGTPSLFSAAILGRLLDGIAARLDVSPECEITLEANPGTTEQARLAGYRAAGFNRISLGVQSFDDDCLQRLGRIHGGDEARRAIDSAQHAGFERINLDLMFALPNQTPEMAQRDVCEALRLGCSHLSYYQLTLEPNTPFARQPPPLPEHDTAWAMQQDSAEWLEAAGLQRYEVSAWARPGEWCRHNLNYWTFGPYLGIGAGAHGLVWREGRAWRRHRQRHPRHYLAALQDGQSPLAGECALTSSDLSFEFMMNALRLVEGVESAQFVERTGLPLTQLNAARAEAEQRGLLCQAAERLQATPQGFTFLDELLQIFLNQAVLGSTKEH